MLMYHVRMKEEAYLSARSRIPKPVDDQCGVQEGSALEIVSRGDQDVLRKKSHDLDDMMNQITPYNLHAEWNTGVPQGREEW